MATFPRSETVEEISARRKWHSVGTFVGALGKLKITSACYQYRITMRYEWLPLRHAPLQYHAFSHGKIAEGAKRRDHHPSTDADPLMRRTPSVDYIMYWPPFADRVEPVMRPASSDARNATQRAISSGSPSRPIGICGRILFSNTSFGTAFTISVAI